MNGKTVRTLLLAFTYAYCFIPFAVAANPADGTPVEHESQWWPEGQGGDLSTVAYRPSEKERPFFKRLPEDEIATGSFFDEYDISTRDKKYVGWFGIVRKIEEDTKTGRTVLTVEHKYFDGMTDAHLQAVSFNGSGDFQAVLGGTGKRIPPLSLIRVYGTVTQGKEGVLPRVDAVFVRDWHWGTFTFLAAYGTQHGSDEWRKLNQIPLKDIYDPWPHPCHHYYEERLGKRPDTPQIRKRLLDAAGGVSPEVHRAMERLADLLAMGHTWSRGETFRKTEEFEEIRELIKKTGSQKAAIGLLLQALHANDERISWSASEKFAAIDPAGDAVGSLIKLLYDAEPRVRAGAARALCSGYGTKAAPTVTALSRCITETDHDLREYAIRDLGEIGPKAKEAVPLLKKTLAESDPAVCLVVVESLWQIDPRPDDVIPALVAVLKDGVGEQRYWAAERLKEMGPWAEPAVPALIEALKDEDWANRCNIAEALGEIGPKAAAATPALEQVLQKDKNAIVRANAAEALGKISNPKAVPSLIAALEDEDYLARFGAIEAIQSFGAKAKAAIPALVRILKDDEENGWFAAQALGAVDTDGKSTPALIEALGSDSPQMRRFAALGLGGIGPKARAAEEALRRGVSDKDAGARIEAAAAYYLVCGKADEPVRALRSTLQNAKEWQVRMWAAGALAKIGPAAKEAVPELTACLKSDVEYVVTSSADALGKIGPDAATAVPDLIATLEASDDHYTRVSIAQALWRINRWEKALSVFEDAVKNSDDFRAVSEAAEGLGEMGPQAAGCKPRLQPLLKNGDPFIRKAAAKAIEQLEGKDE